MMAKAWSLLSTTFLALCVSSQAFAMNGPAPLVTFLLEQSNQYLYADVCNALEAISEQEAPLVIWKAIGCNLPLNGPGEAFSEIAFQPSSAHRFDCRRFINLLATHRYNMRQLKDVLINHGQWLVATYMPNYDSSE